jgi:catechol 2,3-dioxygenase-like lactoylglutathione lyase family enzyme
MAGGYMIKSIQHHSFTVSNIEEALHFFCDLLGMKANPIHEVKDNERFNKILNMEDAWIRLVTVQTPDNSLIELIEYVNPKGKKIDLQTCNFGVSHIAFMVEDVEKMYQDLSQKGVKFNHPPLWGKSVIGTGEWCVCYVKGPDNITLEFIERKV